MSKFSFLFTLCLFTSILLSGCATKPNISSKDGTQIFTTEQRIQELQKNKSWQLKGKIAFIQKINAKSGANTKGKRESASISWHVDEIQQTQSLNLTSYLGINVLKLESKHNQHTINVDGKEYQSANLAQLIYSLTGLTLPTKALVFWLKSLPYGDNDILEIDENTNLPTSISSFYNNTLWQVSYSQYQAFDGINMATKLTIKKDDLLIKFAINKWSFNN